MFTAPDPVYVPAPPVEPGWHVRKDDPEEIVKIIGRERSPNGKVVFEWVAPKAAEGNRHDLPAKQFFDMYYDPNAPSEDTDEPPKRPTSFDGVKEWRKYALWLEERYARPKPPVMRDRVIGQFSAEPLDTSRYRNDDGPTFPGSR